MRRRVIVVSVRPVSSSLLLVVERLRPHTRHGLTDRTVNGQIHQPQLVIIEKAQRRFTNRLRGLRHFSYANQLKLFDIRSLELHFDLIFVTKLFGLVRVNSLIATLKPQSNGPSYSNTVIGTLTVDGCMGCYIWYSEEGTGRGRSPPPRPLLAVPNVTAHPSTASVPTSYYSM